MTRYPLQREGGEQGAITNHGPAFVNEERDRRHAEDSYMPTATRTGPVDTGRPVSPLGWALALGVGALFWVLIGALLLA